MNVNILDWETVEEWCAMAFFGIGGLWLASGIVNEVHRQQLIDELAGVHLVGIAIVVIFIAMTGTFVALLGLYPRLARRSPRLALAGIVVGALSALGSVLFLLSVAAIVTRPSTTSVIFEIAGVGEGIRVMWGVGLVLYPVGSGLFGVGSLRTDTLSRSVGYLLLVPIVLYLIVLGTVVLEQMVTEQYLTDGMGTIIALLMAVDFLVIGYLLHTGAAQPTHTEPSPS